MRNGRRRLHLERDLLTYEVLRRVRSPPGEGAARSRERHGLLYEEKLSSKPSRPLLGEDGTFARPEVFPLVKAGPQRPERCGTPPPHAIDKVLSEPEKGGPDGGRLVRIELHVDKATGARLPELKLANARSDAPSLEFVDPRRVFAADSDQ